MFEWNLELKWLPNRYFLPGSAQDRMRSKVMRDQKMNKIAEKGLIYEFFLDINIYWKLFIDVTLRLEKGKKKLCIDVVNIATVILRQMFFFDKIYRNMLEVPKHLFQKNKTHEYYLSCSRFFFLTNICVVLVSLDFPHIHVWTIAAHWLATINSWGMLWDNFVRKAIALFIYKIERAYIIYYV